MGRLLIVGFSEKWPSGRCIVTSRMFIFVNRCQKCCFSAWIRVQHVGVRVWWVRNFGSIGDWFPLWDSIIIELLNDESRHIISPRLYIVSCYFLVILISSRNLKWVIPNVATFLWRSDCFHRWIDILWCTELSSVMYDEMTRFSRSNYRNAEFILTMGGRLTPKFTLFMQIVLFFRLSSDMYIRCVDNRLRMEQYFLNDLYVPGTVPSGYHCVRHSLVIHIAN
jgi:hypothetical protein